MFTQEEGVSLEAVSKLSKALRLVSQDLTVEGCRFLVQTMYSLQKIRIIMNNRLKAIQRGASPMQATDELLQHFLTNFKALENQARAALTGFSESMELGRWCNSIPGIGPTLTCSLLSTIKLQEAPTVGHIWAYAGLDPTRSWGPGEKMPWNGFLKKTCYLIGESFVKVHNNPKDIYGQIYVVRKEYETAKNEAGDYADQAKSALSSKNYGDDTIAKKWYLEGKLPPARIHRRSARYAVKLFLSHYHHVGWLTQFGQAPAKPYIFTVPGHTHYIEPPNWPLSETK